MCTAVSYNNCFGRNLDLERGYNERVIITPKNFSGQYTKFAKKLSQITD